MIRAYELRHLGRFDEAIAVYENEIAGDPNKIGLIDGLAKALLGARRYEEALPLLWRVHEDEKARIHDHPGQQLQIACACWCIGDIAQAIELTRGLCTGILNRSIGMAPDHAGGATYGLILHYMAYTAKDGVNFDCAIKYLEKLNSKYEKKRDWIQAPQQSVRQLLGKVSFEQALQEATYDILTKKPGVRNLDKAKSEARNDISITNALRVLLFHDGAYRRVKGDEVGCISRMKEVCDLGINGELVHWYLARHEIDKNILR